MNNQQIYNACNSIYTDFKKSVSDTGYEFKGVLDSEMLIVCALAKELNIKQIIESGRARGHSTHVLTSFFDQKSGVKIHSIEKDKYTEDAYISTSKFKNIPNLRMHYGDSFDLLPNLVKEKDCLVVIDGPKGRDAVLLASKILQDQNVKAVFIHDLHSSAFGRRMVNTLFDNVFYTDDEKYVSLYRDLDDDCWAEMKNIDQLKDGWGPYLRRGEPNESYGNTFAVIFNTDDGLDVYQKAKNFMKKEKTEISLFKKTKSIIRTLINTPKQIFSKLKWQIKFILLK